MRAGADVYACARMRLNSISGQGFALYIYIYFNNSLLLLLILNPLSAGDFTVVYLALIMPCFVCVDLPLFQKPSRALWCFLF